MTASDRHLETYGASFLQSFEAIRRSLHLYPGSHPKVAEQLDRFLANLADVHRNLERATFNVVEGEFYINGLPLKRLSLTYSRSLAEWDALGLGLVRFALETSRDDTLRFFLLLGKSPEELAAAGGVGALLMAAGIRTIRVTSIASELTGDLLAMFDESALSEDSAARGELARARCDESRSRLTAQFAAARATAGTSGRILRTVAAHLEKQITEREPVAELLLRLREHHPTSWRHAVDGAMVAALLARRLGLGQAHAIAIGEAAALRDMGKLHVSPEALDAPEASERLTAEYRRHPGEGARLLLAHGKVDPAAVIVALEHHARYDGRGFPALRARGGLHPHSRIVAVAAAYDRLAGARAGSAACLPAEALARLVQGAGSAYDPAAVRALVALLGILPEATGVKLQDGRYGVVVAPASPAASDWSAVEVAILRDREGRDLERATTVPLGDPAEAGLAIAFAAGAAPRPGVAGVALVRPLPADGLLLRDLG